jgi:hypothetical protein
MIKVVKKGKLTITTIISNLPPIQVKLIKHSLRNW